ncbi:excinuclease ABC subunit UvrA [Cerasicoccus arenae]|uniref:UvrABC system protein A n=1 Tax=Cerasicoccus arenae TaxID=424488 RepID=A0A8J3GD59_9BACT|nr:excinuclease ABC subunit UvrA [Cerasicoccus arenae]MBK1858998.1 excinuclease ABC subunit UvrA [Cerasicoccus arenae]GHB94598.1 UvrABC system protein A [Cerasicoccus arenae]
MDIHIKGAREHNLQNLELRIPREKLVVITGVSGSGKSSLAFDTLYAEGYRKYVESLSTRARQLLEQIKRPEVDFIHGLSPVVAIEQRSAAGSNPRSTVATITEIADYSRLLWAVCGEQFDPIDGGRIERRSLDDCIRRVYREPEESRLMILAPVMTARASVIREEIPHLRQKGFQRVRIAGTVYELDEAERFPSQTGELELEVIVDRIVLREDQRSRLADSLELAFREGLDRALVMTQDNRDAPWKEIRLSRALAGATSGQVYDPLTPRHFSWNHPEGACETCGGVGQTRQFNEMLLVPDPSKSVKKGAIKPLRLGSKGMIIKHNAILKQLAEQLPFDPNTAWEELPADVRQTILGGGGERLFSFKLKRGNTKPEALPWNGVLDLLDDIRRETSSDGLRARLLAYQVASECPSCHGQRLNARARNVLVSGKRFTDFLSQSIGDAHNFVLQSLLPEERLMPAREALIGLEQRLGFLVEVGLSYMTLDRAYSTLSGGEAQRVRLATQLGMGLVGVCYVLDEPSIGLHPHDNDKLIHTLLDLRNRGNAVVVVEHDEATIRVADWLIELGPGAGAQGGKLVFEGTPEECKTDKKSRTGPYLSGQRTLMKDVKDREPAYGRLTVLNAREHNLRGLNVGFPLKLLTVVCGVSGSGKSTLVNDVLAQAASWKLNGAKAIPGAHDGLDGLDAFKSVIRVDQDPIGRSPRSNPATYTKVFDHLRDLYAKCPLSKVRGYKGSRFSFNVRGGRCERCQGDGQIKLDMQFLGDVFVECPSCHGRRYNRETLEVRFKGVNIAEALDMTVDEALAHFKNMPKIAERLQTLSAVGLGYVKLGQPANSLSGGEAQRIKLSLELAKRQQGETLYLLDEPTTGLHWDDIQKLLDLLYQLREAGNTIILIEHHSDIIRLADWVIELGPGGGSAGGHLVYEGKPAGLKSCEKSLTGRYL